MGVKGLTSYIHSREEMFFDPVELHDCSLVIDGNALAHCLYNNEMPDTVAFGGDYDTYGVAISKFIDNLRKCNITPIVVFDGALEIKKYKTTLKRLYLRVLALETVIPSSRNNDKTFPLLMRLAIRVKCLEMNVITLQSDYEADCEIACLAKKLDAPVLSNDSDFYVFGVKLIPISFFHYDTIQRRKKYYYVPCKMFNNIHFLERIGGLERTKLPLLAALMGNDYSDARLQNKGLFHHLKFDNVNGSNNCRRIGGLVNWLRTVDFDTAVEKVMVTLRKSVRRRVMCEIKNICRLYTETSTELDKYLPPHLSSAVAVEELDLSDNLGKLCVTDSLVQTEDEDEEEASDDSSTESDDHSCEIEADDKSISSKNIQEIVPAWFLLKYRTCGIPSSVVTLLRLKVFFSLPQPEWYFMPHSGELFLPLIRKIGGLLLGKSDFKYWSRKRGSNRYSFRWLETIVFSPNFGNFPSLHDPLTNERKWEFFKDFLVLESFQPQRFPEDWQLLMMSIVCWAKCRLPNASKPYVLHSVFMMLILVNVIKPKIGGFYKKKAFMSKYGCKLNDITKRSVKKSGVDTMTLDNELSVEDLAKSIPLEDCLVVYSLFLSYCSKSDCSQIPKTFIQSTIYSYAQLQVCIEYTIILNAVLDEPFNKLVISNFYNGTLLFNIAEKFRKRSSVLSYLEAVLPNAPHFLKLYEGICKQFECCFPQFFTVPAPASKKKKKKKKSEKTVNIEESDDMETVEYHDTNNRFSLLYGSK